MRPRRRCQGNTIAGPRFGGTPMGAEWYYESDGQQHGPLAAGQLRQLAAEGKLQAHHLLWKEGMQKKVPAHSVKGLFGASATLGPAGTPASPNPPAGKAGAA